VKPEKEKIWSNYRPRCFRASRKAGTMETARK
jgi:hypothetical protein